MTCFHENTPNSKPFYEFHRKTNNTGCLSKVMSFGRLEVAAAQFEFVQLLRSIVLVASCCCSGCSALSYPPHKLKLMSSIPGGGTKKVLCTMVWTVSPKNI